MDNKFYERFLERQINLCIGCCVRREGFSEGEYGIITHMDNERVEVDYLNGNRVFHSSVVLADMQKGLPDTREGVKKFASENPEDFGKIFGFYANIFEDK